PFSVGQSELEKKFAHQHRADRQVNPREIVEIMERQGRRIHEHEDQLFNEQADDREDENQNQAVEERNEWLAEKPGHPLLEPLLDPELTGQILKPASPADELCSLVTLFRAPIARRRQFFAG